MISSIESYLYETYASILQNIKSLGPKILGAILIVFAGALIARILYLLLMALFKKFKLNEFVDKLKFNFDEEKLDKSKKRAKKLEKNKFTDKIKVDDVIAKSVSYYVFIIFLRISISYIGITEIEEFLKDLIYYLPNLFIGVMIGFFGIRFANFVYDVVYHAFYLTKEKTGKIIASGAKAIILFFTLMAFLSYAKIVSEFVINTILIGFISMLSLAGGLAFGLGGKDIAREILESFKK